MELEEPIEEFVSEFEPLAGEEEINDAVEFEGAEVEVGELVMIFKTEADHAWASTCREASSLFGLEDGIVGQFC